MEKFEKKWDGKAVEDDGCYMSKEARSFVTGFRNMLKREFPDSDVKISAGHYDLHGFVIQDGLTEYVSYSIPRYGEAIDFGKTGAHYGVLYRSAKGLKDFHGGHNHFASLREFPEALRDELGWRKKYGTKDL